MSNKDKLIQGLNKDLTADWGTIMRYTYQAGKSFGIAGAEIREMRIKRLATKWDTPNTSQM